MDLFADAYRQLASISAVLGSLAFTVAAALLAAGVGTSDPEVLGVLALGLMIVWFVDLR